VREKEVRSPECHAIEFGVAGLFKVGGEAREVILEHLHAGGMDVQHAPRLDVSLNTVKTQVKIAYRTLRDELNAPLPSQV
jgi:hypothetical protein